MKFTKKNVSHVYKANIDNNLNLKILSLAQTEE